MFFIDDGDKKVIKRKTLLFCSLPLIVGALFTLLNGNVEDSSYVSHGRNIRAEEIGTSTTKMKSSGHVPGVSESITQTQQVAAHRTKTPSMPDINYRAKQVIVRDGIASLDGLPVGTNCIGKLISTIDSRYQNQMVKVILPYGASYKNDRRLERNTMLLGSIQYPGNGNKVYLTFTRGVTPEGREFKIDAQALSSQDYSPGLTGVHHGNADLRIATTLGLSLISGITEVMTEKEALGEAVVPSVKATMTNGLYHGVSKATKMEASRQAGELRREPEYVTVDVGSDLIVSLTNTFKGILR